MLFLTRRLIVIFLLALCLLLLFRQRRRSDQHSSGPTYPRPTSVADPDAAFKWRDVPPRHPVDDYFELPTGAVAEVPRIQFEFKSETTSEKTEREKRLGAVKEAFVHAWHGYQTHAWAQDEVGPLSGESKTTYGGWGATLVDSLDTLWIMGLKDEFDAAVTAVGDINFGSTDSPVLNTFETTIRYLGGLLSAYDVSGRRHMILLEKAVELGDMLYVAFDTPNRMPLTRWSMSNARDGNKQEGVRQALLSEVGSFTLEFTRLSQLTGDARWFDAITRVNNVFYNQLNNTKISGLWPVVVDTLHANFYTDRTFTLGGQADSFYEYLPKQYLMLGGRAQEYQHMYLASLEAAKANLFFRPMTPQTSRHMLMSGVLERHPIRPSAIIPETQHLTCFVGGMVALGAKIFNQPAELETARQLVDGCLWAYEAMPSGIMPEIFHVSPCRDERCEWSEETWISDVAAHRRKGQQPLMSQDEARQVVADSRLPPGITRILGGSYFLRPEAIESIFILYRITGDKYLLEEAWKMFSTITAATRTDIAFASLLDVREPAGSPMTLIDEMQSFWTAETLKYFFLIFSDPDLISLDDYVFNTEAHPLLRPK